MKRKSLTKDGTKLSKNTCIVVLEKKYFNVSDYKKALGYFELNLYIVKDVGDKGQQARAYRNIGNVHYSLGGLKTAMEYHQQCLRHCQGCLR